MYTTEQHTHVKIANTYCIAHDDGGPGIPAMGIRVARGYLDPTDFQTGLTEVKLYRLIDGQDPVTGDTDVTTHYTDLLADLSNDGEAAVQAHLRVLYQFLLDQTYYAGTIESGN